MKKLVLALFCVTMLAGCFPADKGLQEVTAKDAAESIENKDSMILLVGKTTCDACKELDKVIDEFVKNHDVRISQVFLDKEVVTDEETGEETTPDMDALEQHIGVVGGTPSLYFIKDGVIIGSATGSMGYESFQNKVEKYGFLPEE